MSNNLRRIILTLPFVLMTGVLVSSIQGALADHNPGHSISASVSLEARVAALETRVAELETLLSSMSISADGQNVYFTGVNVHVRNDTESTNGIPDGLGNLIVGYDEQRLFGSDKNGSHNLIIGREHNYTSFGGLVAGFRNTISGGEASVSGGSINTASGLQTSVSGGSTNTADGAQTSVSGGRSNTADGAQTSVSGGSNNTAILFMTSVSGGWNNTASGNRASVSGGRDCNETRTQGAAVGETSPGTGCKPIN
jgi:hypothetical protein